jgi:hypothetical protein
MSGVEKRVRVCEVFWIPQILSRRCFGEAWQGAWVWGGVIWPCLDYSRSEAEKMNPSVANASGHMSDKYTLRPFPSILSLEC